VCEAHAVMLLLHGRARDAALALGRLSPKLLLRIKGKNREEERMIVGRRSGKSRNALRKPSVMSSMLVQDEIAEAGGAGQRRQFLPSFLPFFPSHKAEV
jgi:hypothetical protein